MTTSPPDPAADPAADLIPARVRPFFDALTPAQQQAALLVLILNGAADPSFKSRYARRWWGMLEDRVKLCAMTSPDLVRFSAQLSRRLGGAGVARNADHRVAWEHLLVTADADRVLDACQHDTPVLVAVVRAVSDVRRETFDATVKADRGEDVSADELMLL